MDLASPQPPTTRVTFKEFLAFEDAVEAKHEFYDGSVRAREDISLRHITISRNLIVALDRSLHGNASCEPFGPGLRIWVGSRQAMLYPDASVITGTIKFPEDDDSKTLVCNPTLIFEILSKTSEREDRGSKFAIYRELASMQEYVLVSQATPTVEIFRRCSDGLFVIQPTIEGLTESIELRSLGISIPLSEIYRRIDFAPATETGRGGGSESSKH